MPEQPATSGQAGGSLWDDLRRPRAPGSLGTDPTCFVEEESISWQQFCWAFAVSHFLPSELRGSRSMSDFLHTFVPQGMVGQRTSRAGDTWGVLPLFPGATPHQSLRPVSTGRVPPSVHRQATRGHKSPTPCILFVVISDRSSRIEGYQDHKESRHQPIDALAQDGTRTELGLRAS